MDYYHHHHHYQRRQGTGGVPAWQAGCDGNGGKGRRRRNPTPPPPPATAWRSEGRKEKKRKKGHKGKPKWPGEKEKEKKEEEKGLCPCGRGKKERSICQWTAWVGEETTVGKKRVWAENSSGSEGVTFISVRTCGKFSGSTSLCYRRTGVPRQKDGISRRRKRREEKKGLYREGGGEVVLYGSRD